MSTSIRNGKLFCHNCGCYKDIQLPMAINDLQIMGQEFITQHKDCKKTWQEPSVDASQSISQRMNFWLKYGERGMSSNTMFEKLSGVFITEGRHYHPMDPCDFKRCFLLLCIIPEWNNRLDELRSLSPVWNNLVDNWAKLTQMLFEQMNGDSNDMYEFMKSLGC